MIKKLGLTTAALSVLLLSGCGGGSSDDNTENFSNKKIIVIIKEINSAGCTLIENGIKQEPDLKNPIVESTSINTTCATYNRTATDIKSTTGGNCAEQTLLEYLEDENEKIPSDISILEDKTKSCVVGFDI